MSEAPNKQQTWKLELRELLLKQKQEIGCLHGLAQAQSKRKAQLEKDNACFRDILSHLKAEVLALNNGSSCAEKHSIMQSEKLAKLYGWVLFCFVCFCFRLNVHINRTKTKKKNTKLIHVYVVNLWQSLQIHKTIIALTAS